MKKIAKLLFFLFIVTAAGGGALLLYQRTSPTSSATDYNAPESPAPTAASVKDIIPETPSPKPVIETPEPSPEPTPEPEPEPRSVTLMAVGDNLMHMGVVRTGQQADGSLNYDFLFQKIAPFLDFADVKIINQETILAGNELGFSGFPFFNSPTEVGDSIASCGFNVVLHASNHTADKNISGIESCINFWKQHPEVLLVGIHEAPEEGAERDIPLLTVEDTTFAILNYTYGPNAEVVSSKLRARMEILCDYDKQSGAISFTKLNPQVLEDIRAARELADIVVVCPHWGTEYRTTPTNYQKTFALQMAEAGADVIIGTHPHVVEPVEWIEAENGNRALCFYSLGNFVSTQKNPLCMLEAMAWVTFDVSKDGVAISEEKSGVIPLVCHYTSGPVRIENIYLFEDYTKEQADAHGIRNYGNAPLTMSDLQQWIENIFGENVLTKQEILPEDTLSENYPPTDIPSEDVLPDAS